MSDVMIKVDGLGKKYIISHQGSGSYTALRDVIAGKAKKLMKSKNQGPAKEEFWALKDVSFEIKAGEAVGIIGRNGAGKSTLLKVLSRITEPTNGKIEINGRVASLLEVGTGFHPELTGRENIFLNGAILGMSRAEIKRKFDEIVDFSGVEKFLDTPVKRYSSGMYVRLAFAVAAHLEPEILVVDEVLAVGDAEFQKKCLGKMESVSKSEGRTVLFVSHNIGAIQTLCDKAILLNGGQVVSNGKTNHVLDEYIRSGMSTEKSYSAIDDPDKPIQILSLASKNEKGENATEFGFKEPIYVNFSIKNFSSEKGVRYNISVLDILDRVITVESIYVEPNIGHTSYIVGLPSELLTPNKYKIGLSIDIPNVRLIDLVPINFYFEIISSSGDIGSRGDTDYGFLIPAFKWIKR